MPFALFVVLAAAAVTPGQTVNLATSAPVFATPAPKGVGYYIMQGTVIISAPFANASDCMKALVKVKGTQQPGVNTLVCAHRAP